VNNPEFNALQEMFEIGTVPYLVITKNQRILFKGVPTNKSHLVIREIIEHDKEESKEIKSEIDEGK
jgi:hypothetical protein